MSAPALLHLPDRPVYFSPPLAAALIQRAGARGRIFRVRFLKRGDESVREMTARLGVTKGLKGKNPVYDLAGHDLLLVYDMQALRHKSVPLENVLEVRVGKEVFRP